jgi:phage baseplate assembly protein W
MSFDLQLYKGDLKLTKDGKISIVTRNSKLRQDIVKILLTQRGSVKYHKSYGSAVGALRVGHYTDERLMKMDIEASAKTAIKMLIALQRAQSKRQTLSPAEVICDVKKVRVERDQADPRLYNIFISVLTKELSEITESITVRLI